MVLSCFRLILLHWPYSLNLCLSKRSVDPAIGALLVENTAMRCPARPVKLRGTVHEMNLFNWGLPSEIHESDSVTDFTGVGPVDRTGVESVFCVIPSGWNFYPARPVGSLLSYWG